MKHTEVNNNIAQSFNDHKRLQSFNRVKSYPPGTRVGRVCKEELLEHVKHERWLNLMMLQGKTQHTIQTSHIFQTIHTEC